MTHLPINIPQDFEIQVQKGDKLKTGDIIAKKVSLPSDVVVDVAKRLGVSVKGAKNTIKKNPGDYVDKGDLLAKKEGFFNDVMLFSEVRGTVAKYDRENGRIVIRLSEEIVSDTREDVVSPIDGKVSMCDNGQIILETDKNVLLAKKGSGLTAQGVLKIFEKKPSEEVQAEEFAGDAIGKIVFAPGFTREVYAKASAIGVGGLLSMKLSDSDLAYLSEKRLDIPVLEVSEDIGLKIAKWANKELFVDGQNKAILPLSYEKSSS